MNKVKDYEERKKKILADLKNHKPKDHSEKVYDAPKPITINKKVYKSKVYEVKQ